MSHDVFFPVFVSSDMHPVCSTGVLQEFSFFTRRSVRLSTRDLIIKT